ncbi:MAG TPA: hypothetical protein VGG98_08255 [Solirubrobacteraceae bacterium]
MTPTLPTTIHLHPTADLAERVLLPGDPGRALALAQALLERPLMFNHNRGLWGYTGTAADGEPLTIQSTGMGGPSAAIVFSELIALGARRAIRVGTCGALRPALDLGDLIVARESICLDGASRALGAGERASADVSLTEALRRAHARTRAKESKVDISMTEPAMDPPTRNVPEKALAARAHPAHVGTIVSVDLFYDSRPPSDIPGALAVEMEAATLFALGATAGVPVACVLAVSDTFSQDGARRRIDDQSLLAAAEMMGTVAVTALSA